MHCFANNRLTFLKNVLSVLIISTVVYMFGRMLCLGRSVVK